jgi:Zn-finger nucleic acid-binding protein
MKCIKCDNKLETASGKKDLNWCVLCKGIWIGKKSLIETFQANPIIKDIVNKELIGDQKIDKACPDCNNSLNSGKLAGTEIVVEKCLGCEKYFFDDKEINKLLDHLKVASLPKAGEIDWQNIEFVQSKHDCPVCITSPLFGAKGKLKDLELCIKCHGSFCSVSMMQNLLDKSLFGASMFEFRKGGDLAWVCRFCNHTQLKNNEDCESCHRKLQRVGCPSCDRLMAEYQLHDVVIDRCHTCNTLWFDAGEFNKVIQIQPDIKRQVEREFVDLKIARLRTEAISEVYIQGLEETRREMIKDFWDPVIAYFLLDL